MSAWLDSSWPGTKRRETGVVLRVPDLSRGQHGSAICFRLASRERPRRDRRRSRAGATGEFPARILTAPAPSGRRSAGYSMRPLTNGRVAARRCRLDFGEGPGFIPCSWGRSGPATVRRDFLAPPSLEEPTPDRRSVPWSRDSSCFRLWYRRFPRRDPPIFHRSRGLWSKRPGQKPPLTLRTVSPQRELSQAS